MTRPPDTRALKDQATEAIAKGDVRGALDAYDQLAMLEPDDARWLMKKGEAYRTLGDKDAAVDVFRQASAMYARQGYQLRAVAACRLLLQMVPDDTEALRMLQALAPRTSHPGAAGGDEIDGPDLELGREERISIEQLEVAKVLPSHPASGAPEGTREVEIDRREPPQDTGYLDLSFEEFEQPLPEPKPRPAAQPVAAPQPTPSSSREPSPPSEPQPTRPSLDPERLRGVPLLGPLPPEALEKFVRGIELITVAPGDKVIREGDEADCVYIVVRGDLVASRGSPPRPLARLGEGAFFGEMALLDDTPRSANVDAVTDAELLVLPRRVVIDICEQFPSVLATLMQSLRSRLIATLTATSPLFARIQASERKAFVERFRLREIEAGTTVIKQGQRAEALYVILTGRAEVRVGPTIVATLTTGDVFGEMSILSAGRAEASVLARTKLMTLSLPAHDLQEIVMVHPPVLEHLATLSETRRNALQNAAVDARSVRRV